jgi:Acetyltransferase (GNAT) domain/PilZ domain
MSIAPQKPETALRIPERRFQGRHRVRSLACVNVGTSLGVVSDINEGGLGLHAAASEIETHISTMTFHLPGSQEWLEIRGQIAWLSESKREAGIRFLDLPVTARGRIKEWISLESSRDTFQDESRIKGPQLHAPAHAHHVREVRLNADLDRFVKTWTACHRQFPGHRLHCDPEWIEERFKHEKENVRIFLMEKGGEVVGAVPFVLNYEQLVCKLEEFTLVKFPVRLLSLQGYPLNMPEEAAAYDSLMRQILKLDFDAMFMGNVDTRSFLWNYLQSDSILRREFRFHTKKGPLPHSLVRLDGTFESYLKRFSAKARKNRLREIKLLRERGQVDLLRVSQPSEIDAFLKVVYEISERTWKFSRRGLGLVAPDPPMMTRTLRLLAERGWLRSYVLRCAGVPCSFILGHQYGSSFYAEWVAVDDAWRGYSAGTVILLLVLEDLFKENPPEFYDFGTYAKFQENFATESYPEATVWLFRRRAYPMLASSIFCACDAITMRTGAWLDSLGLKLKIKKILHYRERRPRG